MLHFALIKRRLLPSAIWLTSPPCLRSSRLSTFRRTKYSSRTITSWSALHYDSNVEAEPLKRYRPGGYHPTHLGDLLKNGRYQIEHKLGWGGYGTVWLATDQNLSRYVAIKILVAEALHTTQEAELLENLSLGPADHPGKKHIVQLLDDFEHKGPNGTHPCLVLELLGSSVANRAEAYKSFRLPGALAWEISKQTSQALAYIQDNGIIYGDLHTGNIAFTASVPTRQGDGDFLKSLEKPHLGNVTAAPGQSSRSVPSYLVEPISLPFADPDPKSCHIKIIDFGEASMPGQRREHNTPLVLRPPEYLFDSQWDFQSDTWSLGCTLFELIIGYPPFDNIMPDRACLIRNWVSMFGTLPEDWRKHTAPEAEEEEKTTITDWLRETYFDEGKTLYFSEADIERAGAMLESILKYRPSERPQLSELLEHSWFQRNPIQMKRI